MFRRLVKNLPCDPHWPEDLSKLALKVNDHGQFIDTATGEFFTQFATDNHRANEVCKEAIHECARRTVIDEVACHGLQEIFLTGATGTDVVPHRPRAEHVRVLSTQPEMLKKKKIVIVVVGEHCQDLGIWAYRSLMKEGGLHQGSALGMVRRLQRGEADHDTTAQTDGTCCVSKNSDASAASNLFDLSKQQQDGDPGLIILNPGELLYSPSLYITMGHTKWLARPKSCALDDAMQVHEVHNRVPGHCSPREHIETVFSSVIPQMLSGDVDSSCDTEERNVGIYVIGIADGAEHFVKYMNDKLAKDRDVVPGAAVKAIALCQPCHNTEIVNSMGMSNFMRSKARSWVVSPLPKGTLIAEPPPQENTSWMEPLELIKLSKASSIGSCQPGPSPQTEQTKSVPILNTTFTVDDESHRTSAGNADGVEGLMNAQCAGGVFDVQRGGEQETGEVIADEYDYSKDSVSCNTFSSGVDDVLELILPNIIDDILDFFGNIAAAVPLASEPTYKSTS